LLFTIIGIDYSLEYAIIAVMIAVGLTISQFVISMLQHWEQFTRIYLEIPTDYNCKDITKKLNIENKDVKLNVYLNRIYSKRLDDFLYLKLCFGGKLNAHKNVF
jgi:hypothetical protein